MFVILPFVTFPIRKICLPARLNARVLNDPTTTAVGTPIVDVAIAVPEDAAPITPHTQLAAKRDFATGLDEEQ